MTSSAVVAAADSNAAATTGALLEVRDLHTWFDTARGIVRAVDGVSLAVRPGQTVGIVGESGSGKSVLARSLMRLLPATAVHPAGQVLYDGRPVEAFTRNDLRHFWGVELAMVFQDPMTSLNPVRKIGVQITEGLRHHRGMRDRRATAHALDLLRRVGIPEAKRRLDQYPHELSGGMRQRVTIAIALACDPRVLIADEPTTALDVTVQKQILDLLQSIQRERHMAMLLITHDLGVVASRTDEVIVMYAGRVMERAKTRLLFTEMRHPYTQALLRSIPRLDDAPHTRLAAIGGRPPDLLQPPLGCRFAPRCPSAQERCLIEDPELRPASTPDHEFACFFPVGEPEGNAALERNRRAGHTAAGTVLGSIS